MDKVTALEWREGGGLDPAQLLALHAQMRVPEAEGVICSAVEEVATRLARAEAQWRQGDWPGLCRSAHAVPEPARRIGLIHLARVAQEVPRCIELGDPVALAAVLAWLMRVGERALCEIWEVRHLSI